MRFVPDTKALPHPLPPERLDLAGLHDHDRVAGDGGGELGEQFGRLFGDVDLDAGRALAKPLAGADDAFPR